MDISDGKSAQHAKHDRGPTVVALGPVAQNRITGHCCYNVFRVSQVDSYVSANTGVSVLAPVLHIVKAMCIVLFDHYQNRDIADQQWSSSLSMLA
jgi:hypothetical protein